MNRIEHIFVDFIPDEIPQGVLYISIKFSVAIHLCVCGCRNKVVTPFSPVAWQLIYDGETVSLKPSIGNWNFDCKSHYWIVKNEIEYSTKWSSDKIKKNRETENETKKKFYKSKVN